MSTTILVTGPDLHPAAQDFVRECGFQTVHTPPYADSSVIKDYLNRTGAVGIVSRMGRIDAPVLEGATTLRVISKHGVGVDNIDLDAAAAKGIPVLVATGANAVSVAEHAIALLMTATKRILPLDAGLRRGLWEKPGFKGRELAGSTLGVWGMGSIAQATAKIAKGLGLKITGFDPYAPNASFEASGVTRCDSFEDLLACADFLSLHCPLTAETRQGLNARTIARMKPGAYVINTARGGLIDEAALLAAIQDGHLAGAGLDSFETEPPPADHPFWDEARIVMTPHIGGVTAEANARVGLDAVRGIIDIVEGHEVSPSRIINRRQLAAAAPSLTNTEG